MDGVVDDSDKDDEIALTNIDDAEVVLIILGGGSPLPSTQVAPKAWRLLGTTGNAGNATLSTSYTVSQHVSLTARLLSGTFHAAAVFVALLPTPMFMMRLPRFKQGTFDIHNVVLIMHGHPFV